MDPLKVTSVMSDSTRHAIYEYIYEGKKEVTVQDVADYFSIHPNVARMHLTKLEEIQLVSSCHEKAGKSGRPYRVYSHSDNEISIHFPPKDGNLFGQLALNCIESFGEVGKLAFDSIGANIGKQLAMKQLQVDQIDMNAPSELLNSMEYLLQQQGLNPKITLGKDNQIDLEVHHCPFRKEAEGNCSMVCSMHNQMLKEMFKTYFGDLQWSEEGSLLSGGGTCNYQINLSKNMVN